MQTKPKTNLTIESEFPKCATARVTNGNGQDCHHHRSPRLKDGDGPEWVQRSRPIKFDDKVIGEIGWGGSRWRTGQRRLELQENIRYQWQFGSHSYVINSQAQKHKPYIPSQCTVVAQGSLLRRMVANECKL